MNRREFFGAGAGLALGAAGIGAAKGAIPDNEWGQFMFADFSVPCFVSDKPELELGHSARWKIQRYPGAKWVAMHRPENPIAPIWDVADVEPIITNCDFTSWLLMFHPPVNERKA